jgi:hypothetical protein
MNMMIAFEGDHRHLTLDGFNSGAHNLRIESPANVNINKLLRQRCIYDIQKVMILLVGNIPSFGAKNDK